jgi:hypothetical protein
VLADPETLVWRKVQRVDFEGFWNILASLPILAKEITS